MKKNKKHVAISVRGPRNKKALKPCEDFFIYNTFGNKTIGIVSDGAGSAKFAKIGAKTICNTLNDFLKKATINNVEELVAKAIVAARQKLLSHRLNKGKSLKEFSATLVGFFYHNKKGVVFHIGDGAFVGLDTAKSPCLSMPENGYFSCETYFWTMDDWASHLRFLKVKNLNTIFLLTDGITPFAIDDNKLKNNFLLPIDDFLASKISKKQKLKMLENTLDNSKIAKLNSDDKTMLWCEI